MLAPKVIAADDLRVGLTAEYEREIEESDVLGFAANSGDFNPMHVDSSFAQHPRGSGARRSAAHYDDVVRHFAGFAGCT